MLCDALLCGSGCCVCVCTVGVSILCVEKSCAGGFLHCQIDLPSLAYAGFTFTKEGITAPQTSSVKWITDGTHTHSLLPWPLQGNTDLDLVWEVELSLWPAVSRYAKHILPQKCAEMNVKRLFHHYLHIFFTTDHGPQELLMKTCQELVDAQVIFEKFEIVLIRKKKIKHIPSNSFSFN